MKIFWALIAGTIILIALAMGFVAYHARQVPDESEMHTKMRLNPDMLRLISIGIVVLICLIAAMVELKVMYGNN